MNTCLKWHPRTYSNTHSLLSHVSFSPSPPPLSTAPCVDIFSLWSRWKGADIFVEHKPRWKPCNLDSINNEGGVNTSSLGTWQVSSAAHTHTHSWCTCTHRLEAYVMGCSTEGQHVICKLSDGTDIILALRWTDSPLFYCSLILTHVPQQETYKIKAWGCFKNSFMCLSSGVCSWRTHGNPDKKV